ncbi:MAG TPA: hypothetical protein VMN76_07290 [Acidobacteriota bacterium]|nr:hypothetical protein [Acidobacteriota bacterium]
MKIDLKIDFHVHSGAAADAAAAAVVRMPVRGAWVIHRSAMSMLPDRARMHSVPQRPVSVRRRPGRRPDMM